MDAYQSWSDRLDNVSKPPEFYKDLVMAVLSVRGTATTGTAPDGQPVHMYFYRDIQVTIRHFPDRNSHGMQHVLLVTYPRFEDVALGMFLDDVGGGPPSWKLTEFVDGEWLEHLVKIQRFRRLHWSDIQEFDPTDPGHEEIAVEVLIAGGMIARGFGSPYTSETKPGLREGVVLHRFRLDTGRLDHYMQDDGTPLLVQVFDGDKQAFAAQRGSGGWSFIAFTAGPWVDEVLETYEEWERSQS